MIVSLELIPPVRNPIALLNTIGSTDAGNEVNRGNTSAEIWQNRGR